MEVYLADLDYTIHYEVIALDLAGQDIALDLE